MTRCGVLTRSGQPCRGWVPYGSEYCRSHHGGRTASTPLPDPYLPGEPPCVACGNRAKVMVGDVPMCKMHAKIAAKKAAEAAAKAAAKAAFREDLFTPTEWTPWAGDPAWQAAMRESLDPCGDNPGDDLTRRIRATFRMAEIEAAYGRV